MKLLISTPCKCRIEHNELHIKGRKPTNKKKAINFDIVESLGTYYITKGKFTDDVIDIPPITELYIISPNVEVHLDRSACDKSLVIKVCSKSNVWLGGFHAVFPKMNIYCKGRVSSETMNEYVVRNLNIYMNPDYKNLSMVDGFRAVKNLHIHYQYNGGISGYYESGCDLNVPIQECRGAASKISIRPLGIRRQNNINHVRSLEAYEILTAFPRNQSTVTKSIKNACLRCRENKIDIIVHPCEDSALCYECMYELADEFEYTLDHAQFFRCNVCTEYVTDIQEKNSIVEKSRG